MIQKIKIFLFTTLLIILPFNIRHVFNFEQIGGMEGFREHISWTLTAFDLVFLLLLAVYLFGILKKQLSQKQLVGLLRSMPARRIGGLLNKNIPLFLFSLALVLALAFSLDKQIAIYHSARIFEAVLLLLVAKDLLSQDKRTKIFALSTIFLGGILQSLIALMQFVTQGSIGLKLLGESVLAPDMLGVSKFEFAGEKFIRAYGTLPHPNILGAFLLLALAAGAWLLLNKSKGQKIFGNVALASGIILILMGISLSYSRSILFVTAVFFFLMAFVHKDFIIATYRKYCRYFRIHPILQGAVGLIIIFVFMFVSYNLLAPRLCITNCPGDNSIVLRLLYNKAAYATINEHPAFGVGPGCFVEYLRQTAALGLHEWELQPVHNLYLLVASELGLAGLVFFLLLLAHQISAKHVFKNKLLADPLVVLLFLLLLLGLADHYFWTTPQAQMLFWLSLALFASSGRISK